MSQNYTIPMDALAEAVRSYCWAQLHTSLGLLICEQALANSPVFLGSTPAEVAQRVPALYVRTPGWDEGDGPNLGPQTAMGNTRLTLELSYYCQIALSDPAEQQARLLLQRGQSIAELFGRPDFRFPGSVTLPDTVQLRSTRPTRVTPYSDDSLSDLGVRIGIVDVELAIQFATFGLR